MSTRSGDCTVPVRLPLSVREGPQPVGALSGRPNSGAGEEIHTASSPPVPVPGDRSLARWWLCGNRNSLASFCTANQPASRALQRPAPATMCKCMHCIRLGLCNFVIWDWNCVPPPRLPFECTSLYNRFRHPIAIRYPVRLCSMPWPIYGQMKMNNVPVVCGRLAAHEEEEWNNGHNRARDSTLRQYNGRTYYEFSKSFRFNFI